jgi:hypothetical protein
MRSDDLQAVDDRRDQLVSVRLRKMLGIGARGFLAPDRRELVLPDSGAHCLRFRAILADGHRAGDAKDGDLLVVLHHPHVFDDRRRIDELRL